MTFDDGYVETRSLALPVLRELDIPVVVFVVTAYQGDQSRFWWIRVPGGLLRIFRKGWMGLADDETLSKSVRTAVMQLDIEDDVNRRSAWLHLSAVLDNMIETERE